MANIKKVYRGMQNGAETINDNLEAMNLELTSGGNVVHKAGDESIAGKKSFTDDTRTKNLEVTGSLKLPSSKATVTTKEGLELNLSRKGDVIFCSFGGEVANATSGKVLTGPWVDDPFRPTETQQLIGHFSGRDTSFHIDLKSDGSMIWWGATIGTAPLTARGNTTYLLN